MKTEHKDQDILAKRIVIMFNRKQYCSYVILKFFWKWKRFSDEPGNSLTHGIIEPLNCNERLAICNGGGDLQGLCLSRDFGIAK